MTRDGDSANPVQAERVEQGQLPLLYKNPQPLALQRHQRAGLREISSFAFARATNSVPLGADEMLVAQADFPIVFTETDPAVAMLGTHVDAEMARACGRDVRRVTRESPSHAR